MIAFAVPCRALTLGAVVMIAGSGVADAQQATYSELNSPAPAGAAATGANEQQPVQPVAAPSTPASRVARWLDVQAGAIDLRHRRYVENSARVTTSNSLQVRPQFKARVKFDEAT